MTMRSEGRRVRSYGGFGMTEHALIEGVSVQSQLTQ